MLHGVPNIKSRSAFAKRLDKVRSKESASAQAGQEESARTVGKATEAEIRG